VTFTFFGAGSTTFKIVFFSATFLGKVVFFFCVFVFDFLTLSALGNRLIGFLEVVGSSLSSVVTRALLFGFFGAVTLLESVFFVLAFELDLGLLGLFFVFLSKNSLAVLYAFFASFISFLALRKRSFNCYP
jgi:hypothetical protein